jgi:Protein of unknown function (DUF3795)
MTAPCGLDCFNCHFYLAKEDPESKASEVRKDYFTKPWTLA